MPPVIRSSDTRESEWERRLGRGRTVVVKAQTGPPSALDLRPRAALLGREQRPVRVTLFITSLGTLRGEASVRAAKVRR